MNIDTPGNNGAIVLTATHPRRIEVYLLDNSAAQIGAGNSTVFLAKL